MRAPFARRAAAGLAVTMFGLVVAVSARALAGGGPENVLLVVNRQSRASCSIANHYLRLRRIPASNVLYLPRQRGAEKLPRETISVEAFRQRILFPVLQEIRRKEAVRRIDYVVYSADLPWRVNLRSDIDHFRKSRPPQPPEEKRPPGRQPSRRRGAVGTAPGESGKSTGPAELPPWPKVLTPQGSINGLTYLWQAVAAKAPAAYMSLKSNQYMRLPRDAGQETESLGFQSGYRFGAGGELTSGSGPSYLLSMMLGVTSGRGNSVDEVLGYLRRAAAADGTVPDGTIYYMTNGDVRSTTRSGAFADAVQRLDRLGVKAEILSGVLPQHKPDVQGAMVGKATFDWAASGSTILPGAICEHLTSAGGVMSAGAGQTPLSEFLRYGAAAASGTVTEPYALQAKFPHPLLHVHYARGCTAAEAFYQSVYGPYQLLIVGDPLCRPWARIPQVSVKGIDPRKTLQGTVTLEPSATVPGGTAIHHFELYVDGARAGRCPPGGQMPLDTNGLADGYHELRVVAVAAGSVQTQGRRILPVVTGNHGRSIKVSVHADQHAAVGKVVVLEVEAPGSFGIAVMQNTRLLQRANGEKATIRIDTSELGSGPVALGVVGMGLGRGDHDVIARPVELELVAVDEDGSLSPKDPRTQTP